MLKSAKLEREEKNSSASIISDTITPSQFQNVHDDQEAIIKPISTYNDWILIMQHRIKPGSGLVAPKGSTDFDRPEGWVIGIPAEGHGLPDNAGSRLSSQFEIGDYVVFGERSIVQGFDPVDGFYAGKHLIVLNERNIMFKSASPKPVKVVDDATV